MREIRLRKNLPLGGLFAYLALFCVTSYALLEHVSIPIPAFSQIKFPILYVGAISLLTQIRLISKEIMRRNHFYVLLTLCVLSLLLFWSMYENRNTNIGMSPVRATLRLVLFLIEMFLVMMIMAETGRGEQTLKFLFWYMLILAAVTDVLMFTRVITFRSGRHENYLVGTKFSAVYLHLNLLTLWVVCSKKKIRAYRFEKWKILLAAAFVVLLCVRVDCITGFLGSLMLVVLFVLIDSPKRGKLLRYTSPVMLMLFLLANVALVFAMESIVSIPFVNYLVEEIFGRNTTLTGRTSIYLQYAEQMEGRWLTGYGFGNGNAAVTMYGYANVQNSIREWVLQVGLLATGALMFLMLQIFHQITKKKTVNMAKVLPFIALIYTYVILGVVETTFSMSFIMWFMVVFMLINERKPVTAQPLEAAS